MAAGALALAAMVLNLVAPRAAHALVATAVQVMNTSATPVMIRDVDAAGRNAYVLSCYATTPACTTAATPMGYTFVVDAISIIAYGPAGGTESFAELTYTTHAGLVPAYIPLTPLWLRTFGTAMNLTAYAGPGTTITVGTQDAEILNAFFTGHLVSTP